MTGNLDEAYLTEIQKETDDSQSSIFDYSSGNSNHARLAVVTDPNDTGILEATDEYYPSLGMPKHKLNEFRRIRTAYNEKDPVKKHNKAFEKANLAGAYKSHIKFNDEASDAVDEIVQRLRDGEDITLVCFEKPPKKCHRYTLEKEIEKRLRSTQ